jgi:hypothetical protein
MTQEERRASTRRPTGRTLKPDSPSRPDIQQEIYYGVRTKKGKVRGETPPFGFVPG